MSTSHTQQLAGVVQQLVRTLDQIKAAGGHTLVIPVDPALSDLVSTARSALKAYQDREAQDPSTHEFRRAYRAWQRRVYRGLPSLLERACALQARHAMHSDMFKKLGSTLRIGADQDWDEPNVAGLINQIVVEELYAKLRRAERGVSFVRHFEIVLDGFDGGSDETDHLVLWIDFDGGIDTLRGLLHKHFGGAVHSVSQASIPASDVDFHLPQQMSLLGQEIERRLAEGSGVPA